MCFSSAWGCQVAFKGTQLWIRTLCVTLTLGATLPMASCDEGAMAVIGLIGNRPDFEIDAYDIGGIVTINATGAAFGASQFQQAELYELYQPYFGGEPYGSYKVVDETASAAGAAWQISLGAPGTYHYRVGIVSYSVDEETGERSYYLSGRSTPFTVEYGY